MPASATIRAGGAFLELILKDERFSKGLILASEKLRQFGQSLKRAGADVLAMSATFGAALTGIVKLAGGAEQAQAAFTAMTGSAEHAARIIQELQSFSGKSPFAFQTLADATRNLLNFGVTAQEVIPVLRTLAEIAGGDADRLDRLAVAFGQTQSKGRLMAEEVRQMVNAGFNPLQEIARTTGKSMEVLIDEMEEGKISAKQVGEAFQSAVGPGGRFNGLLKQISQTALGQFREALAQVRLTAIAIGDQLLPALTSVLKQINEVLPGVRDWVAENKSLVLALAKLAVVLAALAPVLFALGTTFTAIAAIAGLLKTAILGLVAVVSLLAAELAIAVISHPVLAGLALLAAGVAAVSKAFIDAKKAAEEADKALRNYVRNTHLFVDKKGGIKAGFVGSLFQHARFTPFAELTKRRPGVLGEVGNVLFDLQRTIRGAAGRSLRGAAQAAGAPLAQFADQASIAIAQQRGAQIEEAQRLDEEIARTKLEAIADDVERQKKLIEFEKDLKTKELARLGLNTDENLSRLDALARAQEALIKPPDQGGAGIPALSTFSGKLAGQIFGVGGDSTTKQIAANTKKTANAVVAILNRPLPKLALPVGNF